MSKALIYLTLWSVGIFISQKSPWIGIIVATAGGFLFLNEINKRQNTG